MLQHVEETLVTENTVMGVKCASPLLNMDKFKIISGFVPDYMHCVCSGVVEKFANFWFGKNGLLACQIKLVDEIINKIKVPNQTQRLTRGLSERNWWKAREWEN